MLRFNMRPYIATGDVDPGTLSIADQFAEIMIYICREYDLDPDVWGAAQDVFRALKAREKPLVRPLKTPSELYACERPGPRSSASALSSE